MLFMTDLKTNQIITTIPRANCSRLVVASSNGEFLVTCDDTHNHASVIDAVTLEQLHTLELHDDALTAIAISTDCKTIATGDERGTIKISRSQQTTDADGNSWTCNTMMKFDGEDECDCVHLIELSPNNEAMVSVADWRLGDKCKTRIYRCVRRSLAKSEATSNYRALRFASVSCSN